MADDYEIGYGKPPKSHRFRKGRSGNPHGRPAETRNLKNDLLEELAERIRISESGQPLKLSKQRALVKSLTAKALKGDNRAATLILNMLWRILEKEPAPEPVTDLSGADREILERYLHRQRALMDEEKTDD